MTSQNLKWLTVYGFLMFNSALYFNCGGSPDASQKNAQTLANAAAGAAGGQNAGESIPIRIEKVRIDTITNFVQKTTTLEAERKVEIISKASGHVVELATEEGRMVTKDQALASLDEREAQIALNEATIKKENAEGTFQRSEKMLSGKLVSKEDFERSKFEYETSVAQLERAKLDLEYTSIRAPFTGTITKRSIELGDMVKLNQSIFEIADFRTLLAKIYVPEKEIRKITDKQTATITSEVFPGRSFYGKVRMISPVVDSQSGTVKVTVEISNPSAVLQPGMFCSVTIVTEIHPRSIVIPKKALVLESQQDMVFTYSNGLAKRRNIEIGLRDNFQLEILSGLEPGEDVITVGQDGLRDNSPVRIIESEGTPAVGATQPASQNTVQSSPGEQRAPSASAQRTKELAQAVEKDPSQRAVQSNSEQSPIKSQRPRAGNESRQIRGETPAVDQASGSQTSNGISLDGLPSDKVDNFLAVMFSRRPEVKEEFDRRLEKEPDLKTNLDKKRAFIKEIVQGFQKN